MITLHDVLATRRNRPQLSRTIRAVRAAEFARDSAGAFVQNFVDLAGATAQVISRFLSIVMLD
jgi:hypothetical protein